METIPSSQWRSEIRASIHYLRTIRPLVERMASEHAAWARFVGNVVSPQGAILPREQVLGATRFAVTFARLQGRLKRVRPTVSCTTLHEAALAWAEALDLLASAIPSALERGAIDDLRAIGREAGEAQMRLKIFQRTHASTVASLKRMFMARPRAVKRPRPRSRIVAASEATPVLMPLPPWRRPRPALVRRAAAF